MPDKHLNLFYTYNRDAELIENNLTRAFIVLLSILPGETRQLILSRLLSRVNLRGDNGAKPAWDFADAQFALQSNIKRHIPRQAKTQVLLTIATELLNIKPILKGDNTMLVMQERLNGDYTSIPDAWIVGPNNDYCILIEAKTGAYPLDRGQLQAHAEDWFGVSLKTLLDRNTLLSVTWMDVLKVLSRMLAQDDALGFSEKALLSHFIEFLKYYGYHIFDGIVLSGLQPPPSFRLIELSSAMTDSIDLTFHTLKPPPYFALATAL